MECLEINQAILMGSRRRGLLDDSFHFTSQPYIVSQSSPSPEIKQIRHLAFLCTKTKIISNKSKDNSNFYHEVYDSKEIIRMTIHGCRSYLEISTSYTKNQSHKDSGMACCQAPLISFVQTG